ALLFLQHCSSSGLSSWRLLPGLVYNYFTLRKTPFPSEAEQYLVSKKTHKPLITNLYNQDQGMNKNNSSQKLEKLYTPKELAEFLSVTLSTIYNWVKTEKIEAHILSQGKRKSTVRFNKDQIQRFIDSPKGGTK
ncbi:MAG: helix-turn-helix domain-containing protein, partial [Candidatus Latescibacterota bacterium]